MTDSEHPRPTEGRYVMAEPNASIVLYEGRLRMSGREVAEGDGSVVLRWLPSPRVEVALPSFTRGWDLDECKLDLLDRGWSCDAAITSQGFGGLRGVVDRIATMDSRAGQVTQLRFHVPNFQQTHGRPLSHANGGWYRGRDRVVIGEWQLTLDAVDSKILDAVKASGGYAFTHVLACERVDGAPFDPSSALRVVSVAGDGLSFCLGRWTSCALGTGYDSNGAAVWEDWRLGWLSPNEHVGAGFASYPGSIEAFLPGFVRAFDDPLRGRALRNCVHWFIEANAGHGGLEGAIIMTFVALELLAWLELVIAKGESADAFKIEPAHSKIRRYLVAKGIAVGFAADADLAQLVPFISDNKLVDGIEAATQIRNRSVHPPTKAGFKDYPIELREQAWRYAIHLLETAILVEVGYHGSVHDRTRAGWPLSRCHRPSAR